jgi:DNA mismatch endonuclease, patch repair protein
LADILTAEQRSRCMSNIKSKNTGPELKLRKTLWKAGLRYKLQCKYKLPGKPDLFFVSSKVVVFIDGCFWHACPIHGHKPKSNLQYWEGKLERNIQRDKIINEEYKKLDWIVLRFWEHELKENPDTIVQKVFAAVKRIPVV